MPDLSNTPAPYFERTATGIRVVQPEIKPETPEELRATQNLRYPPTEKLRAKLEAEMAAGAKKVAEAAERRRQNPGNKPSQKEIAAQGTTVPVFTPNQFAEYAKNFKKPGQTRSKDA
jgi:hypothetical protein